ncbi:MAG TPA: hypothetical protein PLJ38_04675, partial [bacterium]|nr:hypothetical protein [bacterium]
MNMLIKLLGLIIMTIFFCNSQGLSDNFKEKQLQYYRVKIAYNEKEELLKAEFSKKKMIYPAANIFLRIFKNERILELWIKEKSKKKYKFF